MSPTPLEHRIKALIRLGGPMSIADYMAIVLGDPEHGYYMSREVFGAGGDFITAPEVSQMFGEMLGLWAVDTWIRLGRPTPFRLVELGPGRGTLMADALRAARVMPDFLAAARLHLVETSPRLRERQRRSLAGAALSPHWHDRIDEIPAGPVIVLANEFFDALPIRQFVKGESGWHERLVGLKEESRVFGLSPTPIPSSAMPEAVRNAELGEVYEANLAAADAMQKLSKIVARQGGAILAIDYGYAKTRTGETLQAIRKHTFVDPLDAPGSADLSAHVDFGALSEAATTAGLVAHRVTGQGDFLKRLGIVERADMLSRANPGQAPAIAAALHRLTDSAEMGELFKAFVAASPGLEPPGVLPTA